MPEVILIDPPYGGRNARPQLGTLYLAAILVAKGISVELIDFSVEPDAYKILEKYLKDDVVCVGLSSVIGKMLSGALDVARFVKKLRPDVPVVWGGVHATLVPEGTLKHELVDMVCVGEGENSFPELVQALKSGSSLHETKGIGFKEGGRNILTPKRSEYFDLDTLPPLPYHLINLDYYTRKPGDRKPFEALAGNRILSVETSRGCSHRCSYCVNAAKKEKFRKMSAQKVLSHIHDIIEKGGTNSVTINDDNFFVDKKRSDEILNGIVEKGWELEIFVAVRADYLARIDDSDYELMKKAGIKMLGLGIESASDKVLESINKKSNKKDMYKANERLARHGISAWFHFIYGFPGEKKEDFMESVEAMIKITGSNPFALVNLNRLIPNPGTPSMEKCVELGLKRPETIEEWANIIAETRKGRPPYIDPGLEGCWRENMRGIIFPTNKPDKKEYLEFFFITGYLKRTWQYLGVCGKNGTPLRIAIFGCGAYTIWFEEFISNLNIDTAPVIVAMLDDLENKREFFGLKPVKPESIDVKSIDAIFLSTDTAAEKMKKRCVELFGPDMKIIDIFEGFPPGPYPKF